MSQTSAKTAVVGFGHSKVYRRAEVPLGQLAVDAALAAIADAGLQVSDIDGVVTAPVHPAALGGSVDGVHMVSTDFMIRALNLVPRYSDQGGFMITQALIQGLNAVASGTSNYTLVFRALHNPDGRYGYSEKSTGYGAEQWVLPYGATGPIHISQQLRRYMEKFGGTKEDLGKFIVRNRDIGLLNENSYWAQYRPERLTLDDYLNDRMISAPMGMLDCDLPIQGAAAFIVTASERARDLTARPAYVLGTSVSPEFFSEIAFPFTVESQIDVGRTMAEHLYGSAGIAASDVDVANLYDGYSPMVPFWADSMGLCEDGQGLQWIADPHIPLNTSGGNLGNGRTHGCSHLTDGAKQVMGRAGAVQVEGAELSLVAIGGSHHAGALLFGSEPG